MSGSDGPWEGSRAKGRRVLFPPQPGREASRAAPLSSHALVSDYLTFSLAAEHRINITEPNTFHQVDR